jgi:salicylate hydroxylase
MNDLRLILVGAGVGGLTAALALQRAGFKVEVYEQAPELGEVGAGLTISPNGRHVLDHLMGETAMNHICYVPDGGAVKHYATGETLVDTRRGNRPREQYGAAYAQVHRADLHRALVDAVTEVDPGAIRVNHTFERLEEYDDRIVAHFAGGKTATGDVLIGCDGGRSQVRNVLWGAEATRYTGYIAWRGMVPLEALDTDLMYPDSAVFIADDRSFLRYKVRQGTLMNYVGLMQKEAWVEEGWSIQGEISELLAEYDAFCPEVKTIIQATPPGILHKWGLFDRQPLPKWASGRATLLGDAGHPMTPFLGQGAVMAIEDGMVLARAFEAAGTWAEALERYENARRERGTMVMLESHRNATRMSTRDTDTYTPKDHKDAEALGLFDYNPVTVPV